jgi:transposase
MLTPEQQTEILSLNYGKKKTIRWIARHLQISRKAVASVVNRRSVALSVQQMPRRSIVESYKPLIAELLKRDPQIPTQTVLQRMREQGYLGGYTVVRQWVKSQRELPRRSREAFLRLEFAPGECAQVDWGEFGDAFGDGVKIHCFLMVLCHSRLLYIEFTRSEKFEEFIRCHENAFQFFGGLVPQECWYDNLTSVVTDRMGALVRFNARFLAYMGHHSIHPHACNPARGNEKGRVEGGVKLVRTSFWPARQFRNFEDLCNQATAWRDQVANRREHGATRKVPILHFEAEEKAAMRPVNPQSYDTDELLTRVVPPTFQILYDTNRYSVPWTLVGMSVTIRVNHAEITVFYNERFITRHLRSYKKHQTISQAEHSRGILERKPGASRESWQLQAVKGIGPAMADYLNLLKSGHRSLRNEVARILALATVYGEPEVHEAVKDLLKASVVGVDNLELTLKSRRSPEKGELAPRPLHFQNSKLNRVVPTVDLRRFDALLFQSTPSPSAEVSTGVTDASIQKQGVENGNPNEPNPKGEGKSGH